MAPFGWMLVYAVFLWWFSTGVILFLNHLPSKTFRASLAGASVVLGFSLVGLAVTARNATVLGAYLGFTFALLAWGWQEMSFFMGLITGPRRIADPAARGRQRMWHATQTLLYHEAAIAAVGLLILLLSLGAANQTGAWTYLALWVMRISAKLNVYLGVRNLNEHWVPRRLAYLKAYMTHRRMNWLLPFSVIAAAAAATLFAASAAAPGTTSFQAASHGLVAIILFLAVLEHVAMVVPLPFSALWTKFANSCPVGQDLAVAQVPARGCPHANAVPPAAFPRFAQRS